MKALQMAVLRRRDGFAPRIFSRGGPTGAPRPPRPEKTLTPWDFRRALGIVLPWGPKVAQFLMSEVSLYLFQGGRVLHQS